MEKNKKRREYLIRRFSAIHRPRGFSGETAQLFEVNKAKKLRIAEHVCESIRKAKLETGKFIEKYKYPSLPKRRATHGEFREIVERSPYTEMSRFLEKDIVGKIHAAGLETTHQLLLSDMMKEVKLEFVKITHYAGTNLKVKSCHPEVIFVITPYKFVGKTENYNNFLHIRKTLQSKWILHYPIIRKIHKECVMNLPYELIKLNFPKLIDLNQLDAILKDKAQRASQFVYEFYLNILKIVNKEEAKMTTKVNPKIYLGACTGLFSLHISRSIAHTLLGIVKSTELKEMKPYLTLNVAFNNRLTLSPNINEVVDVFHNFLDKIIEIGNEVYVLERNKIKGYENRCIHLCLTKEFILQCKRDLRSNIDKHYEPILDHLKEISNRFNKIYKDINSEDFLHSICDINFEEGCKKIKYYQQYLHKVMFVPDHEFFTIGKMFLIDYREELHRGLSTNIEAIFEKLCSQHLWEVSDLCETFEMIKMKANQKPRTTEELIETGRYMAWIKNEHLSVLTCRVHESLASLCKIIDLGLLTDEHIELNSKTIHWLNKIWPILDEHAINFDQLKFEAEERLQKVVEDVNVLIKDVYPILVILDEMDNIAKARSYLHSITLHMMKIKEIEKQIDWINKEEVILSFPKSTYSEYEDLKNHIYPFYHLLKLCLDVQRNLSVWQDGSFDILNYETTHGTVEKFHKELTETYKVYRKKLRQAQDENLPLKFKGTVDDPDILNWPAPLKLCGTALRAIEEFQPSVNVMKIICNPCLRRRHWIAMSQIAGTDVTPNAGTTLRKMMQFDFQSKLGEYEIISSGATKEEMLRLHLEKLEYQWKSIVFNFVDYKNLKILTGLDEIDSTVNDHVIEIKNMKFSVFVKPHEQAVRSFGKRVQQVKETVECWDEVQKRLINLIPVFIFGDLTDTIPAEAKLFREAYSVYNSMVILISNESIITVVSTTNTTEKIKKCLAQLEVVHKGVVSYLEIIREYFPRFYFLSNEELLEALSNTTFVYDSKTFLMKIFPGILGLNSDPDVVKGVHDCRLETFNFTNALKRSAISLERLTSQLESQMKLTLQDQLVDCYKGYKKKKLRDLLMQYPVQILHVVSQIYFAENVTGAIGLKHSIKLRLVMQKINENLTEKVYLINDIKDNCQREKLRDLIINDINNVRLIQNILESEVIDHNNFHWETQFKYHYKDRSCFIKSLNTVVDYKFEYLGNFKSLIQTTLTERCIVTVINAFNFNYCALLRGEAYSQKIETLKYIAECFGILFMHFHFSANFTLQTVRRILVGNCLCGSWVCLDNFTRLNTGILSILSQDLLSMLSSKKGKSSKCFLDNKAIVVQDSSFVCASVQLENVTKSLPNSIKVQFRPITMLYPDISEIAEGALLAAGFLRAKVLSKKICCVFNVCKDFFVNIKTYFGLSKFNEVLKCCEEFKASQEFDEENLMVYTSLEMTLYSIIPEGDKYLFDNIMGDVFQDVTQVGFDKKVLEETIITICKSRNIQPSQQLISKVIEIYENFKRNNKMVLLGDPCTGKTTLLEICKEAFKIVGNKKIKCHFINPNYLEYPQLYGYVDGGTKHWIDGIVTKIIRKISLNTTDEVNWLIFDGSLGNWMDHLIPVLEESQLYLDSGEILVLPREITTIFEVINLKQTSPTLISGCSIVYLNGNVANWQLLIKSWIDSCRSDWIKDHQQNIIDIFSWFLPPCLSFINQNCSSIINLNEKIFFKTTFTLFQFILDDVFSKINKKEEDPRNFPVWIQAAIIQAGMLTLSSVLDNISKHKFDEFYKTLWKGQHIDYPYPQSFEKLEASLPNEGYLYDYQFIYRQRGTWKLYQDLLKTEKITESEYMNEFLVPIVDTLRNGFLLNLFIKYKQPFLLVGPSGSGKTLLIEDTLINKLPGTEHESCHINIDIHLTPKLLQEFILSKLNKGKHGVFSPTPRKNFLMFIDNLNLTGSNQNGDLSCLELLRQHLDHKSLYNYDGNTEIVLERINVVGAMGLVEGSQKELCQRFLRHFSIFGTSEFTDDTITKIFSNSLVHAWRKKGFPSDVVSIANMIADSTLNIYKEIKKQCKPTISRCQYLFNTDSVAKVIQGCCMLKKETYDVNKKIYLKLWAHEVSRVFGDRLSSLDNNWLLGKINNCICKIFNENFEDIFENQNDVHKLIFGTIIDKDSNSGSRKYEEITDMKYLIDVIVDCYEKYNYYHDIKLDLTMFEYAVDKLVKLCRILSLTPGNALLLGTTGTGRQSLTKLAAFMYNQKLFQPSMSRNYNISIWNDYIKQVVKEAGALESQCTLLLSEEQIQDDVYLQNIDHLLRNGEIPGLYNLDERQKILELARLSAQGGNENVDISSHCVFLHFNKRCKENLHLILCLSSSGDQLRRRISDYPGLMSCHVMLWNDWPDESFLKIGHHFTRSLNIADTKKENVVTTAIYFHRHSQNVSKQRLIKNKFSIPVTSTNFVHLIRLFVDTVIKKQMEFLEKIKRYNQGLAKLSFAATQISNMQKALAEYQPQLAAMTQKALEMTDQIALETIEVEKASALVRKDEKIASEQAIVAQRLKSECESELAQAIPILEDAISALNTLKPSDITLVKSMKNPPDAIKLVMAAVCVIKDVKPDRIPDPSTGRKIIDYWSPSKRILGDMNFLQTLKDFDKDHIKPEIMVKIRKEYLPHKDFKPHVVAKASSAAEGLCKWIIAMDMYDKVAKEVAPKKEKLEKAEKEYAATMEVLNQKKEEVTRIEAKLAGLHALLEDATKKQLKLQQEVDYCNKKLNSAQKLIGSLSGEKIKWTEAVENLKLQEDLLPGNILLSSAFVAYLSWLDAEERNKIMFDWKDYTINCGLICSEDFSVGKSLSTENTIEFWLKNGIPLDDYFLENGIIYESSKIYSIIIDPEYQAKIWIQNIEKRNALTITKFTNEDYLETLISCMETGKPLLIHEVKEDIPRFLYPLLKKNFYTKNEEFFVDLNESPHKIDLNFKLYLVSNLRYPKFAPEISKRITVIKFSLTLRGLDEKLLNIVTEIEKPELRKLRGELYKTKGKNRKELSELEAKILRTLCESDADILEDEASIRILDQSKDLAKIVREKQEESKRIEETINEFRTSYVSISGYSANLYFCMIELNVLNYIYECSVEFFTDTYYKAIMQSPRSRSVERRCENIINIFTYNLYCSISWFLTDRDQWVFIILIALSILRYKKNITEEEVVFFLNCTKNIKKSKLPNPAPDWLNDEIWNSLSLLEEFESFKGFLKEFTNKLDYWKEISKTSDKHFWESNHFTNFHKLIILKLLKPNQINHHLKTFITKELGRDYLKKPQIQLTDIYNESHSLSPILFITTPSSNILEEVSSLAKKKKVHHLFRHLCFGEGVEHRATDFIDFARKNGSWLLLENCHLCPDWFIILDRKLTEMDFDNTHENFRLWLSCDCTDDIPLELLQNSLKVLDDNPGGLKEKVMKIYSREPLSNQDFFESCPGKQALFTKLLFGFCLFHCVLLERQNNDRARWNTPYNYDDSDFKTGLKQLNVAVNDGDFCNNYLKKLLFTIADCHYGGYLENHWDLRLIRTLLDDFINSDVINNKNYIFNNAQCYGLPKKFDYQDYLKHITALPEEDDSAIYGIDDNTSKVSTTKFFNSCLTSALTVYNIDQPIDVYSNEFFLITTTDDLLKNLPELIESKLQGNFVLQREIYRYNSLLKIIKESLLVLKNSINGNLVMSQGVMDLADDILRGSIPKKWDKFCYPTQSNLGKLFKDLNERVGYFRNVTSDVRCAWLGAFFFPKSIICEMKLNICKRLNSTFEDTIFFYEVKKSGTDNDGILTGLYLVGAQWNRIDCKIENNISGVFNELPPVQLCVGTNEKLNYKKNVYECPIFQTSKFKYFVDTIDLPTDLDEKHWIKYNVKIICQNDI